MRLRPLRPGGTIAVTAPAFPADTAKVEKGIAWLEGEGYTVVRGATLNSREGYLSGSDALRADELNLFFCDPDVDAIICARGGWGTLRLLDRLDYRAIAQNPKMLCGYSDITSLQLALWHKSGIPSLSGPMVAVEMASGILPFTETHFTGYVHNTDVTYSLSLRELDARVQHEGSCDGPLVGGCLSLISHLLGTPYMPDLKNAVLFIEDVGEEPYKMDRYLAHLRQAGVFDAIAGLIIGQFLDCEDPLRPERTIDDVLYEYIRDARYPVVYNFPYGHGMHKVSMPVGAHVILDTQAGTVRFANIFATAVE
ncbi:MAG: LD-carboxypeptidase [Calditrichaeota bacterium]|nr:MAG: LD-carboxypeptidase [Calditrichota bacterium]